MPKSKRGFASMDPARVQEIARMGAAAAQAKGTSHKWTKEEASAAGKKGGRSVVDKLGSAHMAELGRRGGNSRQNKTSSFEKEHHHG